MVGVSLRVGVEEEEKEDVEGVIVGIVGAGEWDAECGGGAASAFRRDVAVGVGVWRIVRGLIMVVNDDLPVMAGVGAIVEEEVETWVGMGEGG